MHNTTCETSQGLCETSQGLRETTPGLREAKIQDIAHSIGEHARGVDLHQRFYILIMELNKVEPHLQYDVFKYLIKQDSADDSNISVLSFIISQLTGSHPLTMRFPTPRELVQVKEKYLNSLCRESLGVLFQDLKKMPKLLYKIYFFNQEIFEHCCMYIEANSEADVSLLLLPLFYLNSGLKRDVSAPVKERLSEMLSAKQRFLFKFAHGFDDLDERTTSALQSNFFIWPVRSSVSEPNFPLVIFYAVLIPTLRREIKCPTQSLCKGFDVKGATYKADRELLNKITRALKNTPFKHAELHPQDEEVIDYINRVLRAVMFNGSEKFYPLFAVGFLKMLVETKPSINVSWEILERANQIQECSGNTLLIKAHLLLIKAKVIEHIVKSVETIEPIDKQTLVLNCYCDLRKNFLIFANITDGCKLVERQMDTFIDLLTPRYRVTKESLKKALKIMLTPYNGFTISLGTLDEIIKSLLRDDSAPLSAASDSLVLSDRSLRSQPEGLVSTASHLKN